MSDLESALPPCSSSPPSDSTSAALNYAFLVHSQKTLTQNLPPRVDNKLLARQKRRRTSPEDHAILESEYQRNPKPDKTVRASIVDRVSLGEKEVQIWFQNRRQNDRRKSKPLQPHELLAPRVLPDQLRQEPNSDDGPLPKHASSDLDNDLPSSQLQSSFESDPASGADEKEDPEHVLQSSQTSLATEPSEQQQQQQQQQQELQNEVEPEAVETSQDARGEASLPGSAKRKRSTTDLRGDASQVLLLQQQKPEADLSKEVKSPPSLRISLSLDGEAMVRQEGEQTPSPPKGRNALRISMSSDGKAVIRADDEPSPSKNRLAMLSSRKSRLAGLRRSHSAMLPGTPRAATGEKDRVFGRSRDPRNWESVFDTDARSALSTPASAQSAPHGASPGLFRSRSQRSLTRSLSSRQNILANPSNNYPDTPVPLQTGDKRRKLSRTVSSLGRLESNRNPMGNASGNGNPVKISKVLANAKKDTEDLEFGDSDKENWIPGTRVSHVRRRTTSSSQRPVLRESNGRDGSKTNQTPGKRSRLSQVQQQRKPLGSGHGTSTSDLGPGVSSFVAGGGNGSGNGGSQEEDLDCIQGLLSLSQGAWR